MKTFRAGLHIILVCSILLSGCGKVVGVVKKNPVGKAVVNAVQGVTGKGPSDEGDINAYVERYKQRASEQGRIVDPSNVSFSFADLSGSTIGICQRGYGNPSIQIDKPYWDKANDTKREMLIFHELGHCNLNRPHNTNMTDGRPQSVMYPSTFSTSTYETHHRSYMSELFQASNTRAAADNAEPLPGGEVPVGGDVSITDVCHEEDL